MVTQLLIRLTSTKPIFFSQQKQKLAATLVDIKGFNILDHHLIANSKSVKAGDVLTPTKPTVIPNYPPKGPRPILPELDEIDELPFYKPEPVKQPIPEIVPLQPSKPSKPPEPSEPSQPLETEPNPKPTKKPKPQRKSKPKRKVDPETDPLISPEEDPLTKPEPIKEPSPSPKKPKRFRRVRGKRFMLNLNDLNSKQTTQVCKKFPFFQPNPKFKFKPDPEATRLEPGKSRGLGRRKSSVAQVKLTYGQGHITINGKSAASYLQGNTFLLTRIEAPLYFLKVNDYVSLTIRVNGGGLIGQADAIKLGISRALCNYNIDYRYPLRNKGYLTRDARVKERKKYGLKKARKAPQYSKR